MAGPTQAHHDWVKEAFNVDPGVYTQPDDDIEAELDTLDLAKTPQTSVDLSPLVADFANSVVLAAKRASKSMSDLQMLGTIAWSPDDAKGAASVMAKSAPAMSPEDQAILRNALNVIDLNRRSVEHFSTRRRP